MDEFNVNKDSNQNSNWRNHSWHNGSAGASFFLKWILVVIVLGFVFCAGVRVGEFKSHFRSFHHHGYPKPFQYGNTMMYEYFEPGMMYNYKILPPTTQSIPASGIATPAPTSQP